MSAAHATDRDVADRTARAGGRGLTARTVALLAVLALALAALAAYQLQLRSDHRGLFTGHAGLGGLTDGERAAVTAAKVEIVNLQTMRRTSFDADFARAAEGMTQTYAVQFQATKTDLKAALDRVKRDTSADVSGAGLVSLKSNTATVIVSADLKRSDNGAAATTFALSRFQLTMKKVGSRWLLDQLSAVGL
ncbi:hypothetical protein M6D93_17190 [Jatrophihabitans telluris]|uniref:Mce-associated membrane protein n=1 Tax=Jatrophihabitans telluris TaxID=2038343 RepID=A0ABY4QYS3_9ACTN|nr:hypothetical protein [Jatrophihabitans telluris]UQX88014.1 hypothetical protein M6D93_17190 [Jatrophihabitans telluris]